MSYLYTFFFCLRRIALVFLLFSFKEDNYQQCVYGLIAIQTAYLFYISIEKPHIDGFYNSLEFFNEMFLLFFFYAMLSFQASSGAPLVRPEHQFIIGYIAIGIIGVIFIVNFLFMVREIVKKIWEIYWKLTKYIAKKKKKSKDK